ncbi:MAG: hypothetical protein NXH97_11395 [Rhodobacteraceae bacterium]|nr:hypothetical protein [Paracoccaceae bacterium]
MLFLVAGVSGIEILVRVVPLDAASGFFEGLGSSLEVASIDDAGRTE